MQPLALERLYHDHRRFLYTFALGRVRDANIAEDLLQETMLAGLTNCSSFEGRASERAWLTGILKHKIVDQFRRPERKWSSLDTCASVPAGMRSSEHDPARIAEGAEFMRLLNESLSALPKQMAQAFILREIEGLGTNEICATLDVSPGNFWVIMSRARSRLRKRLIEYESARSSIC